MKNNNEKVAEVLNDLIQINNDRIEGYERASKETKDADADLRALFSRMADESRQYVSELTAAVARLGGDPATDTTIRGKIYRAWMDVKATFTGKDRKSILASCEYGEDAAKDAYETALKETELDGDLRDLVTRQKAAMKASHDLIKRQRDMQTA
jgi:uncharacterized protein (TIGR02284 family)